jgi:hypothetical protein
LQPCEGFVVKLRSDQVVQKPRPGRLKNGAQALGAGMGRKEASDGHFE